MPAIQVRPVSSLSAQTDLVVIGMRPGSVAGPGVEPAARMLGVSAATLLGVLARQPDLTGAIGDTATVALLGPEPSAASAGPVPDVLAVGVGPGPSAPDALRDAGMRTAAAIRGRRHVSVLLAAGIEPGGAGAVELVRAVVEGLLLGGFTPRPREDAEAVVEVLVDDGHRGGDADGSTRPGAGRDRQLGPRPGRDPGRTAGPADFADALTAVLAPAGVECRVRRGERLVADSFGGVLGVGQGSVNPPCVLDLTLTAGRGAPVGLTGKGITFDSGGINLKRDPEEIAWMKSDMAGAAAIAGAVLYAAKLGLGTDIVACLPLAENMPGGGALRPGDVVTHPDGQTTEVTDTDCEGRLVLADAVASLAAMSPRGIVDVGTLTDAGGVGHALWGVMATDDAWADELLQGGAVSGDRGWRLPLVAEYVELIRSPVADLCNCSADVPDSAVLAATYLRQFAGDVPWAHIDNGSSAYLEHPADPWPKGATGSPLRALGRWLEARANA